jgi:hypothetical protein
MTVAEITAALGYRAAWEGWTDREVRGAFTSDLLSDAMANAEEGDVLITIQAHKNTVAVAVLKDLAALFIASDRFVPEDMIAAARKEDVPIIICPDNQYRCSWRIHDAGGFQAS